MRMSPLGASGRTGNLVFERGPRAVTKSRQSSAPHQSRNRAITYASSFGIRRAPMIWRRILADHDVVISSLCQRSHVTVIIVNDIHLAWPAPEPTRRIQTKHPHHTAWSGGK